MKIAYVVTRAEPVGGVQIHVRDLAIALQSRGHVVTVITSGGGPFVDDLKSNRVPTMLLEHLSVPIRPWRDLRALREIHAALAAVKPDLLAAHSSKAGVLGRLAARRLRIPTVLTAHGWSFSPGTPRATGVMYRQIERGIGTITSKIITVSECDRRLGIEANVVPEDRLVAVYNGISDVPERLRAVPGQSPARMVMVARFEPQKDHPTLLRALSGLTHLPWEIDLVGDGILIEQMRSLSASLGLTGRVHFLGQRTDVAHILSRAQLSLLVTNWEGLPLSILEAMRAGLPVVASDTGGIGESVSDGKTGFLAPRGDVAAVRERIGVLLADPALRERMGAAGRASFATTFTLEAFVANTLRVYEGVLEERADRKILLPVGSPRV